MCRVETLHVVCFYVEDTDVNSSLNCTCNYWSASITRAVQLLKCKNYMCSAIIKFSAWMQWTHYVQAFSVVITSNEALMQIRIRVQFSSLAINWIVNLQYKIDESNQQYKYTSQLTPHDSSHDVHYSRQYRDIGTTADLYLLLYSFRNGRRSMLVCVHYRQVLYKVWIHAQPALSGQLLTTMVLHCCIVICILWCWLTILYFDMF